MCKQAADDLRHLKDLGLDDRLFRRIRPDDDPVPLDRHIKYCNPGPGRYKTHEKNDLNDQIRKRVFLIRNRLEGIETPTPADIEAAVEAVAQECPCG